jgi:tight adherence protein C
LEPKDEEEYSAIQLTLIQAGYRTKSAVRTYHFAQFVLGIFLLVVGIAYAVYNSATGDPTTKATIMSIL